MPSTVGAVTHPSLPIALSPVSANATTLQAQLGHTAGALVAVESQGTTGTLYTVPANKTFSGLVYIQGSGSGTVTVSAATGGTLAAESVGAVPNTPAAVPVAVTGGGGGNAISLATSGNVSIVSVLLVGHVK